MIYFDNAATSFPKPHSVHEAVAKAMERFGANPGRSGHKLSLETAIQVFEAREEVANLFQAESAEDVAFTSNCTHALNFALKGVLKHGDHVVISDLEHNSVSRPIYALFERGVITYDVAKVSENDDEETVRNFKRFIKRNTKLVACSHGSNVWGIRAPVEKLGDLAREHDVLFLVDAAQTAGVVPIDVQSFGIDFLCASGHKSLYGPPGTGILITPLGSVISTVFEGGTGNMSGSMQQPEEMPERLESGTVNTAGIIGLRAGIEHIRKKGMARIYKNSMIIGRMIYDGLKGIKGVKLYTKGFEEGRHLPVISFNIDGIMSEDVTAKLSDEGFATRGGLHCAPLAHQKMGTLEAGAVRVSIGDFNTRQQAERFLTVIPGIKP